LLSASSDAAAKVEIHQMGMQDGIMAMRPLDDGLAIPPDATVTLAPGGDHIMFVGLIAPFEEGQRVPVSLNFERAGRIEASFEVGSVGAKGPRLQIASTEPAAATAPPGRAAVADEPFFTHICGARVMANITVSPGRSGPVEVLVQLEDGDEKPLAADALSVTLSNPDKGIAPVTATAERVAADSWRVHLTAAATGSGRCRSASTWRRTTVLTSRPRYSSNDTHGRRRILRNRIFLIGLLRREQHHSNGDR
jgi:hypothetical protein